MNNFEIYSPRSDAHLAEPESRGYASSRDRAAAAHDALDNPIVEFDCAGEAWDAPESFEERQRRILGRVVFS